MTDFLNSVRATISGFSFGTGGVFAILVLVCLLLLVLSLGRARTLVSLLALYAAFTLQAVFPFYALLQMKVPTDLATIRVGVLLILYIVSFLLMTRSVLMGRLSMRDAAFFSVILMSLVQLGFFISIILTVAPTFTQYIPAVFLPYLATQQALFYWAVAPLILLVFQKRN